MGWLLRRGLLWIMGCATLLYLAILLVREWPSHPSSSYIAYDYSETEYLYVAYLVDSRSGFRYRLSGTACDPGSPSWVMGGYPQNDPMVMYDLGAIYIVHYPPDGAHCKL